MRGLRLAWRIEPAADIVRYVLEEYCRELFRSLAAPGRRLITPTTLTWRCPAPAAENTRIHCPNPPRRPTRSGVAPPGHASGASGAIYRTALTGPSGWRVRQRPPRAVGDVVESASSRRPPVGFELDAAVLVLLKGTDTIRALIHANGSA